MCFENTVRGRSSEITSDSGSVMFGRLQTKSGLCVVESPAQLTYLTSMNTKTVLITGCSSGYGLETARHFHAHGWNVIATMRNPREDVLPRSGRLRVVALDVTKPQSIAAALEASGPIEVLVN